MTIESLNILENDTLIDAEPLNQNFEYLDEKADGITTTLTAYVNSQLASSISNVESEISSIQTTLASKANTSFVTDTLSANGLYVTTYKNGDSWYREWFSDSSKYTRIWIEQGGKSDVTTAGVTIDLPRTMSNTNYTITTGSHTTAYAVITSVATNSFSMKAASSRHDVCWYVCGK